MKVNKKFSKIFGITLIIIIVGLLTWYVLPIVLFVSALPNPHSVDLDINFANNLVQDFERYGKIYEMDDCTRFYKSINNKSIRLTIEPDELETKIYDSLSVTDSALYPRYYEEVLKELDIDKATFNNFRIRLEKSKLREYKRFKDYSIFIVDGFLDDIWGYFYMHNDKNKIELDKYFQVDEYSVKPLERIENNWYRFVGS